jgi:hypothetical protein
MKSNIVSRFFYLVFSLFLVVGTVVFLGCDSSSEEPTDSPSTNTPDGPSTETPDTPTPQLDPVLTSCLTLRLVEIPFPYGGEANRSVNIHTNRFAMAGRRAFVVGLLPAGTTPSIVEDGDNVKTNFIAVASILPAYDNYKIHAPGGEFNSNGDTEIMPGYGTYEVKYAPHYKPNSTNTGVVQDLNHIGYDIGEVILPMFGTPDGASFKAVYMYANNPNNADEHQARIEFTFEKRPSLFQTEAPSSAYDVYLVQYRDYNPSELDTNDPDYNASYSHGKKYSVLRLLNKTLSSDTEDAFNDNNVPFYGISGTVPPVREPFDFEDEDSSNLEDEVYYRGQPRQYLTSGNSFIAFQKRDLTKLQLNATEHIFYFNGSVGTPNIISFKDFIRISNDLFVDLSE